MKKTKTKLFAFAFAVLCSLACFAGCKGNGSTNGAYRLRDSQGDKPYTVLFEIANPSRPIGDGFTETTASRRAKPIRIRAR